MSKIDAKIAAFQAALKLKRDKHVNVGGKYSYDYITEEAITEAVRSKLSSQGVAVYVQYEPPVIDGNLVVIGCRVEFRDAETDEVRFAQGYGAGTDAADKALAKAMTSALRLTLCKTNLQAGDDDGESASIPRERAAAKPAPVRAAPPMPPARNGTITKPQRQRLWAMAKEAGLGEDAMRELVLFHTGTESTLEMTKAQYEAVTGAIDKLIAKVPA